MGHPFSTVSSPEFRRSPSVLLERREERKMLLEATRKTLAHVAELPERLRVVVVDHIFNRKSLDATATERGWSVEQTSLALGEAFELLRERQPEVVAWFADL